MMERYEFKLFWKVAELNSDFIDKFYGKDKILYNLRCLMDEYKLDPHVKIVDKDAIKFEIAKTIEATEIVRDLIIKLGFEVIGDKKIVKRKEFEQNIRKSTIESLLFSNPNTAAILNINKKKLNNITSTRKKFLGFTSFLLKQWGMKISADKNIIKNTVEYFYELQYIDNINNYL